MKRRVVLILLLLVAGAIVNVAVAWGCAYWSPLKGEQTAGSLMSWRGQERWYAVGESRALGVVSLRVRGFYEGTPSNQRNLPRWSRIDSGEANANQTQTPSDPVLAEMASGWPCRAAGAAQTDTLLLEHGISFSQSPFVGLRIVEPFRAIPLRPIWPGFAINTVFYAFIVWLLFAAPFALRRRRRIKRGLCPKCAYPVGANTVCTECGAAITVQG